MLTRTRNRYHLPLEAADTETRTAGCRHTDSSICAKNSLEHVCAFVRTDEMCLAPPASWPKQYRKLKALATEQKSSG